ncbi:hypothetical protein HanRHA438_Chr11g0510941 [Helianthus annuus]|nr:hypothetical protein HanRHA438_Chr11g0510941 [Helianthus annuus]
MSDLIRTVLKLGYYFVTLPLIFMCQVDKVIALCFQLCNVDYLSNSWLALYDSSLKVTVVN